MTFDRISCAPVEWILGCSQTVNSLTVRSFRVVRDQCQAIGLGGVEHVGTKFSPYRFRVWYCSLERSALPILLHVLVVILLRMVS